MNTNSDSNIPNLDIIQTEYKLTFKDHFDHWQARWGIKRSRHRVEPGLYALGNPVKKSQVFVTSNYTLSFDALRSNLTNTDSYILVLDTKGINVWCAAGKRTFSTDELVHRIEVTNLKKIVTNRKLILPQLGAPGVAAHEVKQRSGFNVEFGPVCAKDLPEYLKSHKATKEMRRVQFTLKDRVILIPVELVGYFLPLIIISAIFYFIGGLIFAAGAAAAILAAIILFPVLLPWLPTNNFSTKGLILGLAAALPFIALYIFGNGDLQLWQQAGWGTASLLILPPITAFITLNFTGTTTFTSRSGVKLEMSSYIPLMAWLFGGGLLLSVSIILINFIGG